MGEITMGYDIKSIFKNFIKMGKKNNRPKLIDELRNQTNMKNQIIDESYSMINPKQLKKKIINKTNKIKWNPFRQ